MHKNMHAHRPICTYKYARVCIKTLKTLYKTPRKERANKRQEKDNKKDHKITYAQVSVCQIL